MSERRLRRLERAAHAAPSPENWIQYSAALLRQGRAPEARQILHRLTKKTPAAREMFISTLPELNTSAFCAVCGDRLKLDSTGYPTAKNGATSKRKKVCNRCATINRRRGFPHPLNYCGRCGVVLTRSPGHRCTRTLPAWVTGRDQKQTVSSHRHWSAYRPAP